MARIPAGEGLGRVIAEPQRVVGTGGEGNGFQRLGQGIQEVAYREGQARDAADRATSQAALSKLRDDLVTLHDETNEAIRVGSIDKTKAGDEWTTRSREVITAGLESVPENYRALVQSDLDHSVAKLGRGVTKAVQLRDQSDTRAGINTTLEHAGRLYAADPQAATTLMNDTLDGLGLDAGYTPAEIQKAKQVFMENGQYTRGFGMVNGARRDNAALDQIAARLESDEFGQMDPQKKSQLLMTVEGYKVANTQKAEADVRRAQAEQDRRLNLAKSQFEAATAIINTGKVLSPAYVDQVAAAVSGTPYAAALKEITRAGAENVAFGARPLREQEAILTQARATLNQTGTSPEAEKKVAQLQTIYDQAKKDYAEDPLLAAQERGILTTIAPLNTSSPAALIATIGARVEQASIVTQQSGQPATPFLKTEAEQISKMLAALPVEQRSTAIAQLAETVGPNQASAIGRQFAPKDKALGISLAMAGERTSNGRYTSEIVLRGAQAIKDRAVKEDNRAMEGVRARVAAEIGDAFQNPELRATMIEAAVLVEYGLQSEGNGNPRNAVRLATGGITEHNGRKLPLPRAMTPEDFDKRLQTLTPAGIATPLADGKVYVSGSAMTPDEFLKKVPDATLVFHDGDVHGVARYGIQTGAGLAKNSTGQAVLIEVR